MKRARELWAELVAVGRRWGLVGLAALLALAAVLVWTDRPGLEASYVSHFSERPVLVRVDDSLSLDLGSAGTVFHYTRLFKLRWRGWLETERSGNHRFRLTTGDPVRLLVDGQELISPALDRDRKRAAIQLEPGLHRVEIELDHTTAVIQFATEMRPPGGSWEPIPPCMLYPSFPGPVRRMVRSALDGFTGVGRNLTATFLALLAALTLWAGSGGPLVRSVGATVAVQRGRLQAWAGEPRRRTWLGLGALVLLAVVSALAIFPRTGSPFGFDDVRYLDIAAFDRDVTWVLNRYAHVYLLDLFIWLAAGDAFLGARIFWSAQFGVILAALAISTRALGPGLQLGTFAVSLFLLFCQPLYFMRAGAAVPDTTVGTLVMAAVALYLHRHARAGPGRFEWQILLIGALTVWATKSKELGVILGWLVVLFLFERGRLDWRGFVRKLGYWILGVVCGLALLGIFDTIYFGDPLYGVRPSHQQAVGQFNLAPNPQQAREIEGWMDIVSEGRSNVAKSDAHMRYMALLVVAAALMAAFAGRSIELRLLHLMPVLYLIMLMVIHVRATYVFLPRYLYPVVPLSCFLGAAAFHYLGLDEVRWRDVRSPRFFVPAAILAFAMLGIFVPYVTWWIEAADFLPVERLAAIDWKEPEVFVRLVLGPVFVLTLVLGLALFRARPIRLLFAFSLLLVFLSVPFVRTIWELRTHRTWQRGENILHGLRLFGDQIPDRPWPRVQVSLFLMNNHRFFGYEDTCGRIVKTYLRRRDVKVTCWRSINPTHELAFLDAAEYTRWLEVWPGLEQTATFSPAREIVLVRPSEAADPPDIFQASVEREERRREARSRRRARDPVAEKND